MGTGFLNALPAVYSVPTVPGILEKSLNFVFPFLPH